MPGDYTNEEILELTPQQLYSAAQRGWKREVPAVPAPVTKPEPRADVWASKAKSSEDFVCPSGQTCRLQSISPEDLLERGMLDQVTRLEGLADVLVQQAEGQPPQANKVPSREDFRALLEVLNAVVPLAVAEPKVYEDGDESAPEDAIRVSDIDLEDRVAILEKALEKIRVLDRFRNPR